MGTNQSKWLWVEIWLWSSHFCYERFVILAQFLNRSAGSHCFWSPVVDFLKPAAKSISKTNLSNSENIFASKQKTLGQEGSQNFWKCKTVSKDLWTCSSHHSLSSMKVLIWDLKLINSENMCHKSVKTNLFTAVKNQILYGEILNRHRTGTYNVDYRYMHLVWL